MVRITDARCSAPSFKAWAIIGKPLGKNAHGHRPSELVVVARDIEGRDWQHERIFGGHERSRAVQLRDAVEARGEINPRHWRKTHKEY